MDILLIWLYIMMMNQSQPQNTPVVIPPSEQERLEFCREELLRESQDPNYVISIKCIRHKGREDEFEDCILYGTCEQRK